MAARSASEVCPTFPVVKKDKSKSARNYLAGAVRIMMKKEKTAAITVAGSMPVPRRQADDVERHCIGQMTMIQEYFEKQFERMQTHFEKCLTNLELTINEEVSALQGCLDGVERDVRDISDYTREVGRCGKVCEQEVSDKHLSMLGKQENIERKIVKNMQLTWNLFEDQERKFKGRIEKAHRRIDDRKYECSKNADAISDIGHYVKLLRKICAGVSPNCTPRSSLYDADSSVSSNTSDRDDEREKKEPKPPDKLPAVVAPSGSCTPRSIEYDAGSSCSDASSKDGGAFGQKTCGNMRRGTPVASSKTSSAPCSEEDVGNDEEEVEDEYEDNDTYEDEAYYDYILSELGGEDF